MTLALDTETSVVTRGLKEHTSTLMELSEDDVTYLTENLARQISVNRPLEGSGLFLNPGSFVGVIVLPSGLRLDCEPKTSITNLLYMLEVANRLPDWARPETTGFERIDQIFDLVAHYFAVVIERRLAAGLYRTYALQAENLNFVRGQIRFREDMLRNSILRNKIFCEFTEFTADIPDNQVLRQACRLLSGAARSSSLRKRFMQFDHRLGEVSLGRFSGRDIRSFQYNRFNMDYKLIHDLCSLFIEGSSLSESDGPVQSGTFLINMNYLFEQFITEALIDRQPAGYAVRGQEPSYLDVDRKVHIIPDVVVRSGGAVSVVLDCKYKLIEPDQFINTDVYQVFSYCQAFKVSAGLIVSPRSEVSDPSEVRIKNDGPLIRQLTINLETDRLELEAELNQLAGEVFAPPGLAAVS